MVAGIILASGQSVRMQQEKLLLDTGGMPLLERVIRAAGQSGLDELVMVYRDEAVRKLADGYPVTTVYNAQAAEGRSAAIRAGIAAVSPAVDGCMFLVGDQPLLTAAIINTLLEAFARDRRSIIVPRYGETCGNPVTFPAALLGALAGLRGDCGGKAVISSNADIVRVVAISDADAGRDIDTPQEYAALRALLES